ncbi:sugar phosphate isomerase/epimerase family protein [Actinoplanes sp. NPDC051411]|uniref:sugar phosphate isomerase/epimerase family protein n=1 Tax=Actinoplanes sp. NPDC051411 TaxID=3155522 RepID=UPI00343C7BA1
MKFSVFTASTPDWTPAEAARNLAEQGWDGVEWRVTDQAPADPPGFWAGNRATWPLTGLEENLAEIGRVTREAGLEFSGVGAYVKVGDRPDVVRVLSATAALGAGRVRLTMPALGDDTYPALFAQARADLEWAVARAAAHDVKILVELHHRTIVSSASAAVRLVDGLDPAHVGVIHDVGNMVIEGHEDFQAGLEMLGDHLAHVHVKNVAWLADGTRPDGSVAWRADWSPLRSGQADLSAYFRALSAVDYDGWVTSEDFSVDLPLPERTRDNLAYLRSLRESAKLS